MKGISPLLASILLIAITITVASLVSGWFTSTIRSSAATTGNRTESALDCSGASIGIDSVYITGTTNATIKAVVRNNGQVDGLSITNAQAFNRTGNNFSSTSTPVTGMVRGSVATLSFVAGSFASCPDSFSSLLVTTNCGGISDTYTNNPKCV